MILEPMKQSLQPWKMNKGKPWKSMSSMVATLMFVGTMVHRYSPSFQQLVKRYIQKLESGCDPYIQITFDEHSSDQLLEQSNTYIAIKHYLEANSSRTAKKLKADSIKEGQAFLLGMDDDEEITDEYQGVKVWWNCNSKSVLLSEKLDHKQRCYTLSFHRRYRDLITKSYMQHVLNEGIAISLKNRQRKLYTNKNQMSYPPTRWAPVDFKHPATFDSMALKPEIKKEIMDDLITFSKAKDYYMKVGKPWKRGYLLYGPPGTGKSTLIAAMANLLQYDVYDLELTSVTTNTELKKLLLETSEKSIIVIEDIDCSLDLTGERKNLKAGGMMEKKEMKQKPSQLTLSGILNSIDGLWSSCAGERIIVLTTNYVEKLDPALIRRGRMDKHIELSYCSFEAFKVLAKNYLDIESHELFGRIEVLLADISISPADVAENLIPKSAEDNGESCLICLISALENEKEVSKSAANEEQKLKAKNKVKKKINAEESSTLVAAKGDYSIRYYLKYVPDRIGQWCWRK